MARYRKFTDEELRAQYFEADNMDDLARRLDVTRVSVYKHLANLNLPPINNKVTDEMSLRIFDSYNGQVTTEELAAENRVAPSAVRYHLMRAVTAVWGLRPATKELLERYKDYRIYAPPESLQSIKVTHLLVEDETLFDDPNGIAAQTGIPLNRVEKYLKDCFDKVQREQSAEQPVKKNKKKKKVLA